MPWPHAPHRVLRSAIEAAEALSSDIAGESDAFGSIAPVERFSVVPPTRGTTGRIEAMALYAGESVGSVDAVSPAAAIVSELVSGADALLRARS